MAIELKITVNHATDLAAEVQQLAQIIGGTTASCGSLSPIITGNSTLGAKLELPCQPVPPIITDTASMSDKLYKVDKAVAVATKTLNRKEQDEAVAEMVKAGVKDERFELLTRGRQNEVEAHLTKPTAEPAKQEADLDDMFSDIAKPSAATVTREQVSELIGKVGKDKDGIPIQDRCLKIRAIIVDNVPEGQQPKVSNIPDDKIAAVYAAIEKVV